MNQATEFPIDDQQDLYVSRREFVKFLTLSSGGMAVSSAALAVWSQTPKRAVRFEPKLVAQSNEILVGSWRQFSYPREQDACILIHTADLGFVAFSRRCTHLSCPVVWQPAEQRLYCPCHNGAFSLDDGHVLQGPPSRPLPKVLLSVRDGSIYAEGVAVG